ncbi:DMT family transporter [Paenibacillus sp. UNC496MF]|uniref:EamA family transporter n=1 Tax=Paenibacillus sp. UNC496MF TaxID=1502753 RepID=UPI000B89FF6A|nr:DMT family transporter [Paenibacillus sp. UNC496MF]
MEVKMLHSKSINILLMLLAASFLGFTAPLVDFLYAKGFTIMDLTNAQYGFAVVMLWLIILPILNRIRFPTGKDLLFIIGTGATSAWAIYFYFKSITLLPVSLSIVLLFQVTWIVTLLDIIVKRVLPSTQKWIGIAFILGGTILAVGLFQSELPHLSWIAIGYGLLAAVCFGISLYLPEYMTKQSSPFARAALTLTVGAFSLFPMYPPTYLTNGVLFHGLLGWGIVTGLIGQLLPLLFMLISIPKIGGRMAGILSAVELPVTVVSANFLLGETISWFRWLGVLLILIGICFSEVMKPTSKRLVRNRI